jgi:hypothetical protein
MLRVPDCIGIEALRRQVMAERATDDPAGTAELRPHT